MKKFVLTICVVIICMVTALFYGKTGIKTTTGVHDPGIVLSENTAMEIFYTGGQKTSYFNNESNYSVDDMEKDSSLIARITVTNSREMSLRSTKTMVKIEEIYKDNSANLSVGDCIYIIEPVSFVRGEEFYTNGWQYLKTEDTYLIFLKNLGCIDGYKYTKEEENSFMPVSEIYSKRNLTHDESCVVFDSAETLYSSISMFAFLTSEKTIVDNYEKIWKNITNSGKYE